MKKNLFASLMLALLLSLASCGGGKKSASSIAKEWCKLNGKVHKAEGAEKLAAETALKNFENDMEAKYKADQAFMSEIEKEAEKCEKESERK